MPVELPVNQNKSPKKSFSLRFIGFFILILVGAYIIAVLCGLPKDNRIDAATLGVIGLGILFAIVCLQPHILDRITRFEGPGWKIEMIEERQEQQHQQLDDIKLILPILLPEAEQKHLLNLANGATTNYKGNHDLRTELRRLRSLKLLRMLPGKEMSGIANDVTVDIGKFVELTQMGQRWVGRLREIEAEGAKSSGPNT
jgi:hypothetical protein